MSPPFPPPTVAATLSTSDVPAAAPAPPNNLEMSREMPGKRVPNTVENRAASRAAIDPPALVPVRAASPARPSTALNSRLICVTVPTAGSP